MCFFWKTCFFRTELTSGQTIYIYSCAIVCSYTHRAFLLSLSLSPPLQISALSPAVTLSCCHSLISLMQSYNVWQNFVPAPGVAINVVCCWLLTIREAAHRNLNLTKSHTWGLVEDLLFFSTKLFPKTNPRDSRATSKYTARVQAYIFLKNLFSMQSNPIKSNPVQSSPISHPPNKTLIQRAHD